MDDDEEKGYRWEGGYEKTWDAIREGNLEDVESTVEEMLLRARRRKVHERQSAIRLGVMRHIYLIIDFSTAMEKQDLKPTRRTSTLKLMEKFIPEFFDRNPISQLGMILMRNKIAEKLCELGGNPKKLLSEVKRAQDFVLSGEPSLYNALQLASNTLQHLPSHTSREIIIIMASLNTVDPNSIYQQIEIVKEHKIRCSVIGLAADMRICRHLSKDTGGGYAIILDEDHFWDVLSAHLDPPPSMKSTTASLIRMGFPNYRCGDDERSAPSFCVCHIDSEDPAAASFGQSGYYCPQCGSKYCELPVDCKTCGLTLVSAPQLARSYYHFFPMGAFRELPRETYFVENPSVRRTCSSCLALLKQKNVYKCPRCERIFCADCDIYIHGVLHMCPGCASSPHLVQRQFDGNGSEESSFSAGGRL